MNGLIFIFISTLSLICILSAKLPSYLTKCKKNAASTQCVLENTRAVVDQLYNKGEPKFNLPNLTPLRIDKVALQATPDLQITLLDVEVSGFDTFQLTYGIINEKWLNVSLHFAKQEILAKYNIDGKILILPIKGQGNCNITLVDGDLYYKAKFSIEERGGKQYLLVKNEDTDVKLSNLRRVYYQLDNLFNGNEALGQEMNRFLNDNWKEVFAEGRDAVEKTSTYSMFNYFVNGYLHYLPLDELFDK